MELTDIMYALSDPARIAIIRCLAGAKSMTCQQLQQSQNRPKSSMSHHFKILRDAGIVQTKVKGSEHFNSLRRIELEKRFPGLFKSVLRIIEDSE